MAETGAVPAVSRRRRRALDAVGAFFTPLLPDDYLEMIDPLWSTREVRGRIEQVQPEADGAVTVTIRPGHRWPGHRPGQYLRVGVVVDGIHHWRAYSLSSDPDRPDGRISITPKLVEGGKVSPWFSRVAKPGEIVRLGGVEGTFTLPYPLPERLLMISAGSGITPIMAMLRSIERRGGGCEVLHLHSSRTRGQVIFGDELERMAARRPWLEVRLRETAASGRLSPAELDRLCPDWRERTVLASGPGPMLDAFQEHWRREGDLSRLLMERFQPVIGGGEPAGEGGTVRFTRSGAEAECDGATPILVAGEEAGVEMPFGCRMGICRTCVGKLCSGRLRDLRTGEVHGVEGEMVRTCVNAPEGPVEIKL